MTTRDDFQTVRDALEEFYSRCDFATRLKAQFTEATDALDRLARQPAPTETLAQAWDAGWDAGQLYEAIGGVRVPSNPHRAETAPAELQGAPPMLCLAKSKECGGRPCMLPMGHEGNHANWDCDPVER